MAKLTPFTSLSIIVPTINEAEFLPLLLADLNLYPYQYELIIVDVPSTSARKIKLNIDEEMNLYFSKQDARIYST